MEAPLHLGSTRRPLLAVAISLIVGGFLSLAFNANDRDGFPPRMVSPTYGTTSPFSLDTLLQTTTTTWRARHAGTTWVGGEFLDAPPTTSGGPSTTGPQSEPPTQIDVAVPAAGAQVSVGQGPGSCTSVGITALAPDSCPPPDGDGAIIVDPGPTSGGLIPGIGTPKAGQLAA